MQILCSLNAIVQFLEVERELDGLLNGYTLRLGAEQDMR